MCSSKAALAFGYTCHLCMRPIFCPMQMRIYTPWLLERVKYKLSSCESCQRNLALASVR